MNLNNFEKYIDQRIGERGHSYYQDGMITQLEQIAEDEYVLTVEGSEFYNVYIKLDEEDTILIHLCDCPYNMGDVCKHEVAAFYQLRDGDAPHTNVYRSNDIAFLQDELSSYSKEELINIFDYLIKRDREFRMSLREVLARE